MDFRLILESNNYEIDIIFIESNLKKLFKRIRISTFTQLILQVDQVNKMTDGGGDEGSDDEEAENTKPIPNDKEHTTFLDVINGTGEISLKDDKVQAALPPKPKLEQLYSPYSQMYKMVCVTNSSM